MPRKIQPTYTHAKPHRIACMGDSHTCNFVWGTDASDFWPASLDLLLDEGGANARCRNFGVSGDTTGQMLYRASVMTNWETPDICVIYGGTNDTSASNQTTVASGASSTQFTVQSGKGTVFPVGCWILVGAQSTRVTVVSTDTLTVSPGLTGTPSGGTAVVQDTRKNLQYIGLASGASKIIVVGQHYLNYSSGGDTLEVPVAANVTLRTLQSGAATDLGGVFCDFYTYLRTRIADGTDVQGSYSWHVLDSNSHLNAYGEGLLAASIYDTISSQTGWLASIT